MPDTLTLIASFRAKPGEEGRLRDALDAMVEPSEAEPGCLGYRPLVDPREPTAMVIVEEWVDQAALDHHFTTPHFAHVVGVLDDVLAVPFTLTKLTPATAGP